jgi:hypothetical protein
LLQSPEWEEVNVQKDGQENQYDEREAKMRIRLLSTVLVIVMLTTVGAAASAAAPNRALMARLSGGDAGAETDAWGHAVFNLSAGGTELRYRLIVHNIEDTLMAHIHLAPPGEDGPPVMWLYPDAPPPQLIEDRFDGVLGKGTIRATDLVGPLQDMTLEDLLDAMRAGNTYVNVHTGLYPGGEIRGQIESLNP